MATPSIQTLITQAQQVLNLQSSNEIRATLAAVLANANVGTPLNPNLTTQQLWNEFGEIVRQSTDDIMSIITDQMMRMVFSPPAPGGAGADKQVIFNDGGVLAGDAGLMYNKATDALTVLGNLGVGINPTSKGHFYSLSGSTEVRLETAANTAGTTNRLSFKNASGAADARTGAIEWYDVGTFKGDIRLLKAGGIQIRNSADNPTFNLDDTGNVGIGATPSAWQTYKAVSVGGIGASVFGLGSSQSGLVQGAYFSNLSGSGWAYTATSQVPAYYLQINGEHRFHNAISGTAGAQITAWNQAMTLDATGNFLIGLPTSVSTNSGSFIFAPGTSSYGGVLSINHSTSNISGSGYVNFNYNTTNIGSINQSGTTGVLYNITSDYRLKESVKPISGGLARVNALKPSVYNWKSDGSTGEGFLAHELAEVVPFAVSGEKDAVNADGTIKSQGIDMSRIVPILVAAIQELTAEVNALKNA